MDMRITVLRWDQRDGDAWTRHVRDDVVDVSDDVAAWMERSGIAEPVKTKRRAASKPKPKDDVPKSDDNGDDDNGDDVPLDRPPRTASKARWVAYAVSLGMEQDVAEGMSAAQLSAATDQQ